MRPIALKQFPLAAGRARPALDPQQPLGAGLRRRDRREVVGQLVRLLVAGPGSAVGRYPLGNTGGANVSAVTPMPIPADLQAVLDGTVVESS